MYIIVGGGGKVGYYLTKGLLEEGHEVLVIEEDPRRAEQIADELGDIVLVGKAEESLGDAGTSRADMVIAVTGDDEDNLAVCQLAKVRYHVPRTIARINNPRNEAIFKRLGIDATVSATSAILAQIESEMPTYHAIPLLSLRAGELQLVEVRVPTGSPAVGKRIADLALPPGVIVTLVISADGTPRAATPDTRISVEEAAVAVTPTEAEPALRRVLCGQPATHPT